MCCRWGGEIPGTTATLILPCSGDPGEIRTCHSPRLGGGEHKSRDRGPAEFDDLESLRWCSRPRSHAPRLLHAKSGNGCW